MRRFFLFFAILISVLSLAGYYLGNRLISGSSMLGSHSTAVWSAVVVFLCLVILGPMQSRILPEHLSGRFYPVRWLLNMTMAIFFAVLFYTLAVDLLVFTSGFVVAPETAAVFHDWSLTAIFVLVLVTFIIGALQALNPRVYRVDVPIPGLPKEFIGFRIAQISDLHIGEMIGANYVKKVVDKTNLLSPDIVAMTGDIIDGSPKMTAPIAKGLSRLKAVDGTFYVTGNHEYYWGVHNALQQIHQAGAKILMNENVLIRRGSSSIALAGVPDISTNGAGTPGQSSDPAKSVAGVAKDTVKILLAHQPVSYKAAVKAGFHLQLSGHTHGGQFFPWSLVVRMFQHYNKGLIKHEDLWIYVNRGTATWGPRIRFGIPPEISLLTLVQPRG